MPSELRKAHQENDKAVMKAYGFDCKTMTESDCVAELMKLYQEAGERLIKRAFEDLGMNVIWANYFVGNEKSKRAQEKLGFVYYNFRKSKGKINR